MDFQLTEEQKQIQQLAKEYAENELKPGAAERDQTGEVPADLPEQLAELGFMGGTLPEKYGGSELDYVSLVLIIEQFARFSERAATLAGAVSCSLGRGTLKYGSEELKMKYLKPMAEGKATGATAVTEPHSGTDVVRNLHTTAERDGDEYIIDGEKMWISNLDHADWFLTFAQLDPDAEPAYEGSIAVILESDWDGIETRVEKPITGSRTLSTGAVKLNNVRVPVENRIGEEGKGYKVLMTGTEIGRLACASRGLGVLQQCLKESIDYANEREVFEQNIGEYQLVKQKIANMRENYEAAKLLTFKLADMKDRGVDHAQQSASMAKRFTTNAAHQAAEDAVQLHGANGIAEGSYSVGRHFRNSKVSKIYDGTNDIHTVMIADHELGYR